MTSHADCRSSAKKLGGFKALGVRETGTTPRPQRSGYLKATYRFMGIIHFVAPEAGAYPKICVRFPVELHKTPLSRTPQLIICRRGKMKRHRQTAFHQSRWQPRHCPFPVLNRYPRVNQNTAFQLLSPELYCTSANAVSFWPEQSG